MKHLIYQITNTINGKIYVGAHTGTPDDGYMGSGSALVVAMHKYGKESFNKTILHECETVEEMFTKEAEIVTTEFVNRPDTYNLIVGGLRNGGYAFDPKTKGQRISEALKSRKSRGLEVWNKGKKMNYSPEALQKMCNKGKKYSESGRAKMAAGQKLRRAREAALRNS